MTRTDILRRNLAHIGIIMMNFSIIGLALLLTSILSVFIYIMLIMVWLFLLLTGIFTLGIIYLSEEYRDFMFDNSLIKNGPEYLEKLEEFVPLIATITGILCIASFVFLLMDTKWKKARWRAILSGFCLGLFSLLIIIILVTALIEGGI